MLIILVGGVFSIAGLYLLEAQILWAAVGQTAATAADPVGIRRRAVAERLGIDARHTLRGRCCRHPQMGFGLCADASLRVCLS